jgi:hypothetical protein
MHIDTIIKQIFTKDITVLNISFREYLVLFDDYFISVYPYVYNIYSYKNASIYNIKYYNCEKYNFTSDKEKVNNHHHFSDHDHPTYLPSKVFEKVSGFKIHTQNEIEYDFLDPVISLEWDKKYKKDSIKFDNICKNKIREMKFKRVI